MLMWVSLCLYLLIVISLVWGRLFFFKLSGGTPKILAYSYDLAVVCQMVLTVYGFVYVADVAKPYAFFVPALYMLSLVIFWTSIFTAKSLDFAFSSNVGNIVTTGPFGFFRHPFYTSYLITRWTSTILFNSPLMWVAALYLTAFYLISARKEEQTILSSAQSVQYKIYQQNVGMFLPRTRKWKQ
jgi:protein-S-isoprenylcysteine O-methyltransferase Ste14